MSERKPTSGNDDGDKGEVIPLRKPRPCPICGQKSQPRWHPFCSKRCADVDLHRWLSGRYVIPGTPDETAAARDDDADEND